MNEPLKDEVAGVVLRVKAAAADAALEHLQGLAEPERKTLLGQLEAARFDAELRADLIDLAFDVLEGVLRSGIKAAVA